MNIAGIVCEYNPLHTGHEYQIKETRALGFDGIICCMSGNFVQRGDVAMFSKWSRAKAAIYAGADLVVEIPTPYVLMSAEGYAASALSMMSSMNIISAINFGSENGNIDELTKATELILRADFGEILRTKLSKGISFAAARQEAVCELGGETLADAFSHPNNILAIEYIKAILHNGYSIKPTTVKRQGAKYHSLEQLEFISATGLRECYLNNDQASIDQYVPFQPRVLFELEYNSVGGFYQISNFERAILAHLRNCSREDFLELDDVSEGLDYRFIKAIKESTSYAELLTKVNTKRYALTRLTRIIMRSFLGITRENTPALPPYIKVLAFNDEGRKMLNLLDKEASLPIITKPSSTKDLLKSASDLLNFESRCTDLYSLAAPGILPCGAEFTTSPAYIK